MPVTPPPAWSDDDLSHDPHTAADKARRVEQMFAAIAPSYDLNNRLHSLWRDQAWRRAAVAMAGVQPGDVVADIACGTGDLSMAFRAGGARRVVGVDFTVPMLRVADAKRSQLAPGESGGTGGAGAPGGALSYQAGDAMRLPLADRSVDIVSIAFGIRNVADPRKALGEFVRVLRPGGRVIVLEFSLPKHPVLRAGYNAYFKHVLPRTASLIARDRSGAYKYLPKSVNTFIDRDGMQAMMRDAGLVGLAHKPLTCGIAVCYRGVKNL